MNKMVGVVGLMILVSLACQAQFNPKFRNRKQSSSGESPFYFNIGGGFGLGTTNGVNYNYYSLLPAVGYKVTDQVSLGVMATYQRYNYTNTPIGTYSFSQYGGGPFVRYSLDQLFFQTEYQMINAPSYNNNNEIVRANYSRFLIGIGYMFAQGRRFSGGALLMYDVLYKVPSVFNSPLVTRVFLSF